MFIDEVKIKVISGKGWDWLISWRREKYIPKWGPRGGNWGDWAQVYLKTNENINTLSEYRHKKVLIAENGERWGTQDRHWANWEDLILEVPVGTIISDANTWEKIADLDEKNMMILIAKWWRWGFWNSHFCSSTRQAPAFAELWDVSEEKDLLLELKLVADIWIIGIPSSWKSTLIWNITNVKPKIGDYPFTTLTPNLWVLDHKWKSLVLEDVPGLIPWASEWKWLGIEFLKHIERTGVILHLLDLYRLDKVFDDYTDIRKELENFSPLLAEKEEIIVFSKADLLDNEMKNFIAKEFKKKFKKKKIFIISSATKEGIEELKDFLIDNYVKEKEVISEEKMKEIKKEEEIKIYDLKEEAKNPKHVDVTYEWNLIFRASWERLEQIVRMTDFENREAIMRVYDVMERLWVTKKIESKLAKILWEEDRDNSFFFEWNEADDISPKVIIGDREILLNNLKYNLW